VPRVRSLVDVVGEVIVDPPSMTANFISHPDVLVNEILAERIVQDVEASMVAERVSIWSSGDVDGIGSLFENIPGLHVL